jgi:hypothetical protein
MRSPICNQDYLVSVIKPELERLCLDAPAFGELILRATLVDGDISRISLGIETSRRIAPREGRAS